MPSDIISILTLTTRCLAPTSLAILSPGAVLIDVVRSAASDVLGKEARVVEVKNAKFITVIVPDSDVTLNITSRCAQAENGILFKSVVSDSEKIYAKFDLIVKEERL